ncbi:MAG: hypothetical protein QG664_650 [Patescibacteria group bacterium]|nr:hypothetical protein [Patescibacteria group bacterium]
MLSNRSVTEKSRKKSFRTGGFFPFIDASLPFRYTRQESEWSDGRVVRHRSAKPFTAVQFRLGPQD